MLHSICKKFLRSLSFSKAAIFIAVFASALSSSAQDFTYTYNKQTLVYTVVSETNKTCKLKEGSLESQPGNTVVGDLKIPEVADGYTVIEIPGCAFSGCSGLTSITIPGSVTSIGDYAFYFCSGLTSITIPNSVTSIGNRAFGDCRGLTSITIPNSVTSFGDFAFDSCQGLTSITIPASVTSIGRDVFVYCTALTEINVDSSNSEYTSKNGVLFSKDMSTLILFPDGKSKNEKKYTIPDGVTSIGEYAFFYCDDLTSVTIPNSVTSIGDNAFYCCSGLTSITIPNSVTSIGDNAFESCGELTSITIPASVTSIGRGAFGGCGALTEINVDSSNSEYTSEDGVLFSKDMSTLILFPEGKSENEDNYTIPDGVTSIGDYAFADCYRVLTSVTIPNSVTSIGESAFSNSGLTSVSLPESLKNIGFAAFQYCTYLRKVEFNNNLMTIGGSAFERCSSLTEITLPATLTEISNSAFSGCTSLTKVIMSPAVETIGQDAFRGCTKLSTIVMGPEVKTIDKNAFKGATPQNIYIAAQTPPSGSGFSDYSATLWLQGQSAIDAYREETNFWHSFNSSEMTVPSKLVVNKVETRTTAIQLAATLEPADVTLPYVFWYTSDPEVATVDAEGLVTIKDDTKECKITAKTLYANGPEAYITVNNGQTTALEEINPDVSTTLPESVSGVYNLRGVKVGTSTAGLPSGLYIVRQGSSVKKIAI